ncbi:MAG: replicative DNA helicase [Bdellovibrionales bacterium]|nr:replicative DNA helicase [Bdellovibrionales bacterium]
MSEGHGVPASQRKRLPQDLDAERSVLGSVLVNNSTLDQVREIGLEVRDYFLDSHQKIFEAACALSDTGKPIDLVTLTSILRDRGWYDSIGGVNTLTSLFDQASFQIANVVHYGRIVREKALQRRLIETCSLIMDEGLSGVENTEGYIDLAETRIFEVSQTKAQKSFSSLAEVISGNMTRVQELFLSGGEDVVGLPTGFHEFDKLTTGLHPGQVTILAARPGMGKTSWFISALLHSCVVKGSVAALFSLEMSKEELGFRFFSSISRIDSKRLKTGSLAKEEFRRLMTAAEQLGQARIHIDDTPALTVMDLRSRCRRLKSKEKKLDLIVIDYLQLMRGPKTASAGGSREQEISAISRGLKELSKEIGVPIIALSQLSRNVESRTDKRPMLSDLRESGAIEQDADLVCFIYRDDYYNQDSDDKGIAEIIIAKNRHGEPGTVKLAWLGQYTLFANLANEDGSAASASPAQRRSSSPPDDISL